MIKKGFGGMAGNPTKRQDQEEVAGNPMEIQEGEAGNSMKRQEEVAGRNMILKDEEAGMVAGDKKERKLISRRK